MAATGSGATPSFRRFKLIKIDPSPSLVQIRTEVSHAETHPLDPVRVGRAAPENASLNACALARRTAQNLFDIREFFFHNDSLGVDLELLDARVMRKTSSFEDD